MAVDVDGCILEGLASLDVARLPSAVTEPRRGTACRMYVGDILWVGLQSTRDGSSKG